jgi:hypothetical protein
MANTVNILSFTNTFGDLLSQQNRAALELNNIGANNYTKDSGTLFLNGTGTGLSVSAGSILGSGIVANTFSVGGDATYLANVFLNGAGTTLTVSNNANILRTAQANTLAANTITGVGSTLTLTPTTLVITSPTLSATNTTANFNTLTTVGSVQVGGNFIITGSTIYATNTFTIGAGLAVPTNSLFAVYRPSAANAEIKWNESNKYFEINDVTIGTGNTNYYRILTDEFRNDSTYNGGSTNVATSNAVSYLQGVANTANVRLQSIETNNINQNNSISIIQGVDNTQNTRLNAIETINTNQNTSISIIQGVDNTQNTNITAVQGKMESAFATANGANGLASGAYGRANTSANSFAGTSGTATPSTGGITFNSGNGVTISGAGSTLTVNTPQDLRTSATPTFTGLNLTTLAVSGTATVPLADVNSNTNIIASTEFVKDVLMSANTFAISTTGNAFNINQYTVNQSVGTGNNVQHNSLGIGTAASGTAGEIRATNDITAYYSDDRLKTKLGNIENALEKLSTLSGFYYEPNEVAQALGYEVKKQVGVSAQSVQSVMPEVVKPAPIDEQYLTVQYEKLVPLLIEAIKELKAEVDALKNK